MNEVTKCTIDLQNAVRSSAVYAEYQEAWEELNKDPDLKKSVDEFRGKNFEMQVSSENTDFFSEIEKLEESYQQIRKNPAASNFLEKELALCRMVQRISEGLVESIDLDITGLEETIF